MSQKGFYLLDFKSTNGSTVNRKPLYQPVLLQDGDQLCIGKTTFDFYLNYTNRILPTVAMELLMQMVRDKDSSLKNRQPVIHYLTKQPVTCIEKTDLLPESDFIAELDDGMSQSNSEHKSEILDRFFSRDRFHSID